MEAKVDQERFSRIAICNSIFKFCIKINRESLEREGFCLELDVESVVNREISRRLSLDTVVSQLGFQRTKTSIIAD